MASAGLHEPEGVLRMSRFPDAWRRNHPEQARSRDVWRRNHRAQARPRRDGQPQKGAFARNLLRRDAGGFPYRQNGLYGRFHRVSLLPIRLPDAWRRNHRAQARPRRDGPGRKNVSFQNPPLPGADRYPCYRHVPDGYSLSLSSYLFFKLLPPGSKSVLRAYSHGTKIPQLIEQNAGIAFNCGRLSVFLPFKKRRRCQPS